MERRGGNSRWHSKASAAQALPMPQVSITELWLPILLAAVAVFVISSVIHVASPLHKSDYKPLPDEERLLEAMREAGLERGGYAFPYASSMKQMAEYGFIAA